MEFDRFVFSGTLPRGIVESNSDLELKSLWEDSRLKVTIPLPHFKDEIYVPLCLIVVAFDFIAFVPMDFFS